MYPVESPVPEADASKGRKVVGWWVPMLPNGGTQRAPAAAGPHLAMIAVVAVVVVVVVEMIEVEAVPVAAGSDSEARRQPLRYASVRASRASPLLPNVLNQSR